jgi:HK97 family phage major capsid protein
MKDHFNTLAAHAARRPAAVLSAPRADAGQDAGQVAQMLREVQGAVTNLREDLMARADKAVTAAERGNAVTGELRAEIDRLMPQFAEATKAQAKLEGQLEALEARTLDVEQLAASGGRGPARHQTLGQALVDSDQLKAYLSGGMQGSMTFQAPRATVTTADTSGAAWSERDDMRPGTPRRRLRVRELLNVVPTSANSVEYVRMTTSTNSAAPIAEEGTAAASDYGWTKQDATVRKIGHVVHVSDEAMSDIATLQATIDGELRYGLDLVEEAQLLTGDGLGSNLSGLVTEATAFSAAASLPDANRIERLRLAILQVVLADYAPDALVLNPTDWAAIELTKDGDSRYMIGAADAPAGPMLWSIPVIESNSMTAGSWLAGNMFMAATLYDRQEPEVLISSEHATNFIDGMKTIKATKRVALGVRRPASLVTGNFTFE